MKSLGILLDYLHSCPELCTKYDRRIILGLQKKDKKHVFARGQNFHSLDGRVMTDFSWRRVILWSFSNYVFLCASSYTKYLQWVDTSCHET